VRVLLVEDDRAVRDALRRALRLAGYDVESAGSGDEALRRIATASPDLVVLDVGIPAPDGLDVCRRVRTAGDRVPIVMLTARAGVSDRIDGLDAGADDYVVKPFDVGELKARIRALLRRTAPDEGSSPPPSFGALSLDAERHGAQHGDAFVDLTRTEYALLELFLRNPRVVLAHEVIYERVWGYDFGPASNALRVYVGYLRRKLDAVGASGLIQTVRGVGYVLREP
jgi:two-component system, OmpR family, response regulator MprA